MDSSKVEKGDEGGVAPTGLQGQGKDSSERQLQLLKEKHAAIEASLSKYTMELVEQQKILQAVTRDLEENEVDLRLAKDKLRSVEEENQQLTKLIRAKSTDESLLLKDLVNVQSNLTVVDDFMKNLEAKYVDFQVEKAIRKDKMERFFSTSEATMTSELKELERTITKLEEIKVKIEQRDPEVMKIINGDKLTEMEMKLASIRNAFSERDASLELRENEVKEKTQVLEKLECSLKIQEKQNRAKLIKLERELKQLEARERTLKESVSSMDKQIDPAIVESSRLGPTRQEY